MQEVDAEVARLQVLIMEHERLLEQYSDLFRDQQRQIDLLKLTIEKLELKLSKYEHDGPSSEHAEQPPHY